MNAAARSVTWAEFLESFVWEQGEHISLIGPTGGGKTTLALKLMGLRRQDGTALRSHVVALGTKPKDATLSKLVTGRRAEWRRIKQWKLPPPPLDQRLVLWPEIRTIQDHRHLQPIFAEAIHSMFLDGGWTIFADELAFLCDPLRLGELFRILWLQGRSIGVTLVMATQRPAHVPLEAYSQATHLFIWRTTDERDLKRFAGLGGADSKVIRSIVQTLPLHHVLYVNSRTGELLTMNPGK